MNRDGAGTAALGIAFLGTRKQVGASHSQIDQLVSRGRKESQRQVERRTYPSVEAQALDHRSRVIEVELLLTGRGVQSSKYIYDGDYEICARICDFLDMFVPLDSAAPGHPRAAPGKVRSCRDTSVGDCSPRRQERSTVFRSAGKKPFSHEVRSILYAVCRRRAIMRAFSSNLEPPPSPSRCPLEPA